MSERGGLRHNRDYVGWLVGETMSSLGTSISTFAYPVLILFATHSAARTGIVAAASNVGSALTLLIGGALADRVSRRGLLVGGAVVETAVVGSVAAAAFAGHVVLVHVALAGLIDGAVVGITVGADRAALRRLVPPTDYPTALAQQQARDMASRVAGPPLGGALLAAGRGLPFLFDAVSYLASIAGVLAIRRPLGPDAAEGRERESLAASVRGGVRYLLSQPYLRFVAVWAGVMNMLGAGLMLLVIFLVRDEGGSATVIGASRALGSVGGIAGALVSGWIIRRLGGRPLVIALSWGMAAAALGMAVVGSPWAIGGLVAGLSFVAVPLNVILDTYEVHLIPDELLGRVTTTIDLTANGLRWVAPLVIGALVEATSATTTAAIWGAVFVVPALVAIGNKSLHILDRPLEELTAQR